MPTQVRTQNPLLDTVEQASGQPIRDCYQCSKCYTGCPVARYMDVPPNGIIRMIQYGMKDQVFATKTIWLCLSCMNCGVRCPNGIDLGAMMDAVRELSIEAGHSYDSERNVVLLHEEFVRSIKWWGRAHEATMLAFYKLRSLELLTDMGAAVKLILKGKIRFIPTPIRKVKQVWELYRRVYDRAPGGNGGAR
jgi:heterodisulfide reductase subunit C